MAIAFLNNIAFSGGAQAQSLRLENLASDPATGNAGQLYYDTANNIVKVYNGTSWIDIASSYTWTLTADSGTNQVINDDDTVDIAGGTYITTVVEDIDTVKINHDDTTRSDTTSTDTPGYAGTFQAVTSVTTNDQGHVTAIDVSTVTMPSAESYTWTLSADNGTDQTINNGNTVSISGGTNIGTEVKAIDVVTVNLDVDEDIDMNSSGIINLANPTNAQDAATKSYVDGLVEGGLTFKDGFDADDGVIDGGGNLTDGSSRVALEVGDYYVVTNAGNFYNDANIPLTVGDSVIAKTAAAEGTSTSANWVIVQGDEGVVDLTSGNGSASTGNAITSNTSARGSVTIQSFAYAGTDNVGHVPSGGTETTFLRGDGTWATPDPGATGDRVALTGGVVAGGLTTFTYDVTNSFTGASAIDVKCEVISAAGETVYASVTRSGANLSVEFVGSIADSAYEVLLVHVG